MSSQETRKHFKFVRSARNWGITALAAATIGGISLYQRSTSADGLAASLQPVAGVALQTTPGTTTGQYQDGEYQGDSVQAGRWGHVQVTVIIENGEITNFRIVDYPHSRSTSERISRIAIPYLMQETIQAQSASIDMVSGATPTSEAYIQSLQSALDAAIAQATPTTSPGSSL